MGLRIALFTNVFRIRFLKLALSFGAVSILSASGCPTAADDECGQFLTFSSRYTTAVQALTSPDLETSFSGGVRTFSWSRLLDNVCSKKHAKATWGLDIDTEKLPANWHVEAGYLITALSGQQVPLKPSGDSPLISYDGATEIGLTQAFGGEPGRFLVYLDVSFASRGDLTEDREAFQRFFKQMLIIATFNEAKSN